MMTRFGLVLRSLRYFRGVNLAVTAGMAVATAVLAGALMVGDSVRGSLRELALQRLGKTDYALVATRFFSQTLADRLNQDAQIGERFETAPALLLRGGASNENRSLRASAVQIGAVGGGWTMIDRDGAIVNAELAAAVDAKPGSTVLLSLPSATDVPRDATLARRSRQDSLAALRATTAKVVSPPDVLALFSLESSQRTPRNAWVSLPDLQGAVDQRGRVNALLVHDRNGSADAASTQTLNDRLKSLIQLDDYGLKLDRDAQSNEAALNSRGTYIDPPIVETAQAAAKAIGAPLRSVSVYLVNEVKKMDSAGGSTAIHYAVSAGISSIDGRELAANEVAINQWTADRLQANVGDEIRLSFYRRQPGGALEVTTSDSAGVKLKVAAILPMAGLGADPSLTPQYKGLTDADSVADWDPPQGVDIDKSLVTKEDEAYWHAHRAAPKLFVSMETAARLWGGVFGDVTSLRVPADKADAFAAELQKRIDPARLGLSFQPIKSKQLEAASGSTDFAMLFVAFSFFLIVAAAMLVAMLFRLSIEQRAAQLGLLAAVGMGPKSLRRMALMEGMLIALVGGVVGLVGAVGYTWLVMAGLRTWWVGAVGTTALRLHVEPTTLAIGLVSSLFVAFIAVWWSVRRVGRAPAARLLAGAWNDPALGRARRAKIVMTVGAVAALAGISLLLLGVLKRIDDKAAFLVGGAALLVAALCWIAGWLRPGRAEGNEAAISSLGRLGLRNAARHTARSVLSVGLIAFAAFTLVTVASFKQDAPQDTHEKQSGAGGFRLMLQADIPLLGDLNTRVGRDLLGVLEPDAPLWNRTHFTSMRSWAGQDVSCLNLTKPSQPRILAVPLSMAAEKRFIFASSLHKSENLWNLLDEKQDDPNVVPVVADNETAQYILKLGLGDTFDFTDQLGRPRKLKLVATLAHSVFQSELLMSEANFLRLFPSQAGFGVVMIETSADDAPQVRKSLETNLDEYAVTVDSTADRLAAYAQVANTYLSTFQTLGSLGLMLGTIGLAVVLLRNLFERRAELGLLAALGFRRVDRLRMILAENVFLLLLGLGVGAGCALLGIVPALRTSARLLNLPALVLTLLAVLCVGLLGLVVAVWFGQRRVTPAELRAA